LSGLFAQTEDAVARSVPTRKGPRWRRTHESPAPTTALPPFSQARWLIPEEFEFPQQLEFSRAEDSLRSSCPKAESRPTMGCLDQMDPFVRHHLVARNAVADFPDNSRYAVRLCY
jgi:hypothetical protein